MYGIFDNYPQEGEIGLGLEAEGGKLLIHLDETSEEADKTNKTKTCLIDNQSNDDSKKVDFSNLHFFKN